ncbi:hypothetical protein TNCV_1760241 [Trichonephila clavipes]|nr:hypothetical protein TNCV_1760241 [Trichonephila clavipes]
MVQDWTAKRVKFTRSVPNFLWRYYRASVDEENLLDEYGKTDVKEYKSNKDSPADAEVDIDVAERREAK